MTIYNIEFSPESENELEEYYVYIEKDSPRNAAKWYFNMRDKISTLDENPARCPYADETHFHDYEIRNLIIGEYRVLFRIQGKTVQILHIKHGKMKRIPFPH